MIANIEAVMNFDNVPYMMVPLPSNGLVYPPIKNKDGAEVALESVDIRPMTALDENKLHSPALLRSGRAITEVIRDTIVEPKGLNIDSFLLGDSAALMIFLRMISYGTTVDSDAVACPLCSQTFPYTFELSNLQEKKLEETPLVPHTNEYNVILPQSKADVHFQLTTVRLQEEFDAQLRARRRKNVQDDPVTSKFKLLVLSINGEQDKTKLASFIEKMSARDSLALRKRISGLEPDITPRATITCPSCNEISDISIPLGANFFWPG